MVTRIQNFEQHLLYGCFFIGVCAGAATVSTLLEAPTVIDWRLSLAVMGATLVHYNFHYLFQKSAQPANTPRMQWSRSHRKVQYVSVGLGFLCLIPYTRELHWHMLRLWIPVMAIGLTYSFPVMPFRVRRWKEQGLLKWLLLSLAWTMVTAWIPLQLAGREGKALWIPVVLRMEFMLILCWLFDMRDRALDLAQGVETLPARIGWEKSRQLAYWGAGLYGLTGLLAYPLLRGDLRACVHGITALALAWVIGRTRENRSDRFYLGWVDGLLLWHFLCMVSAHWMTEGRYYW